MITSLTHDRKMHDMELFVAAYTLLATQTLIVLWLWTTGRTIRGFWLSSRELRSVMSGAEATEIEGIIASHQTFIFLMSTSSLIINGVSLSPFQNNMFNGLIMSIVALIMAIAAWRLARIDRRVLRYIIIPRRHLNQRTPYHPRL